MKNNITEKWKDETIHQANALAEREVIYRRGYGEGFTDSRKETLLKVIETIDQSNLGGQLNWLIEEIKLL